MNKLTSVSSVALLVAGACLVAFPLRVAGGFLDKVAGVVGGASDGLHGGRVDVAKIPLATRFPPVVKLLPGKYSKETFDAAVGVTVTSQMRGYMSLTDTQPGKHTFSWKYDRYNIAGISLVEYTEHGVKVTIQSVTKDDGLKDATDGYSKLMEKFCNILLKQLQALPAVPPEALRKPEDGAKVDEAETGKQVLKEEQEPKADGKPANAAPISDK